MTNRWTIWGAFSLLAVMVAVCVVATLKINIEPEKEKGKRPVRQREIAEGVKISRHGLLGVDLVSVGRARMRKLRKGPFTIGAINELVLEDVSLVLPEELWHADTGTAKPNASDSVAGDSGERGPKAMLSKLGLNVGQLKMGERIPRFSALSMGNLRVSRIVDATNVVPWFAASKAKATRGGLELYGGWSVEKGVTNGWKEAWLVVEPQLRLLHR